MDAFPGYNQILIHPEDREKTSFITERRTYCYKVMPFGLKNARATYQWLVNEMFSDQLGNMIEVYLNDILVTSFKAESHVNDLQQCFANPKQVRNEVKSSKVHLRGNIGRVPRLYQNEKRNRSKPEENSGDNGAIVT